MVPVIESRLSNGGQSFRMQSRQVTLLTSTLADVSGDEAMGGLQVWYQPIVNPADGRAFKLEALIRWHLDGTWVPASDIVSLAERNGLIEQLTVWVTARAARATADWRTSGVPVDIAVNLSSAALVSGALVDRLVQEVSAAGLEPRHVTFEITESVRVGPAALRSLTTLAERGFKLAVDDLGAGSASLAYLKELPVAEVKIDRQFVSDLGRDPRDSAIVRAIVGLARELGLGTIAEGVETPEAVAACISLGCAAQGFWFSRPLPTSEATPWLQAQAPKRFTSGMRRGRSDRD